MDIFTEYIVKQKKSAFQFLAGIGMIVLTLAVWVLTLPFTIYPIIQTVVFLVDATVAFLTYLVITAYNIEYEYCITNSDMDVDKITNRKKRKRLVSLSLSKIELMAPVGNEVHKSEENGVFANVIMAGISKDHPDAYYIIFDDNGKRTKLIFNPSQKIIDAVKTFAPRKVTERQ